VSLVALAGARIVYGGNGLVNGSLDDPAVRAAAIREVELFGKSSTSGRQTGAIV